MKSAFPGMDPYLERHWLDVQPRLIVEAADALQAQLADDLVARIEERLIVEDPGGHSRQIGPDVRVVEHGLPGAPAQAAGGVALAEPLVFTTESEPQVQRYIEIVDLATSGRVVTVIEFVSPSNKLPGDGREKYLRKQSECRDAGVNVVEVDLTRSGRRELLANRWIGSRQHDSAYAASVWRAAEPSRCEFYPIPLREPIRGIRIPLRSADSDVVLDLQSMLDAIYSKARYGRTIDYSGNADPPLTGDGTVWADGLLRHAGRR